MDLQQLTHIGLTVIAPVIVMAGVGFLVGWLRVLEPEPIARAYLTVFAPAMALKAMLRAELSGADVGAVVAFGLLSVGVLGALSYGLSRLKGHDRGMRGAFINSVILYNSANYGLPVQELAFPVLGPVIQPIVLLAQSLLAFTVGSFNAASNNPSLLATAKRVLLMPLLWAVAAALLLRLVGVDWTGLEQEAPILWVPLDYFARALVPVALLSLGVQLSRVRIRGKVVNILVGTVLRLLAGPAAGLGVGLLLGIRPELLAVLVVSISFPTAVFSSLLATEFRNNAEYAAAVVFVSTVASLVTVTVVIYLAKVQLAGV